MLSIIMMTIALFYFNAVAMLSVKKLSANILIAAMLRIFMLSFVMLRFIMSSVIMMHVVAPCVNKKVILIYYLKPYRCNYYK